MSPVSSVRDHVALLVGGVGGAKLALGMANVLPPGALTIIVNTGDDFEHLGLHISPDLDTVMYALGGLANPATGWGIEADTLQAMDMVERYRGPSWFRLGDRDLGTNLMRTAMLREGKTLTEVTAHLSRALGIQHTILPMSNAPVRTWVETDRGRLAFQEYFVRERWQPVVRRIEFVGAESAEPSAEVSAALDRASLVVFGPSNPFLSVDPILAVPGIVKQIKERCVPCIAVSPIVGGQAVKGPAAKLMAELELDVSPIGVAAHYRNLINGLVLDEADREKCEAVAALGIKPVVENTLMITLLDKIRLADVLLHWAEDNLS